MYTQLAGSRGTWGRWGLLLSRFPDKANMSPLAALIPSRVSGLPTPLD